MVFELEWGRLLPVGVSLAGGVTGGAISAIVWRPRAVFSFLVGLLIAASAFTLDLLVAGPPRGFDVPDVPEASGPPAWMSSTMPAETRAPDFTLADLRSPRDIVFSELRGDRPAVLLFGSFG